MFLDVFSIMKRSVFMDASAVFIGMGSLNLKSSAKGDDFP